jgi:hypothetical protein
VHNSGGIVPDEFLDSLSVDKRESIWRQNVLAGHAAVWVAQESGTTVGWILAAAIRDADARTCRRPRTGPYMSHPSAGDEASGARCVNRRAIFASGRLCRGDPLRSNRPRARSEVLSIKRLRSRRWPREPWNAAEKSFERIDSESRSSSAQIDVSELSPRV